MNFSYKPKPRDLILQKYNGRCAYCGVELSKNWHIDHIEPLRRGEKPYRRELDNIENYNPCCAACNISKSTFTLDQWRRELYLKYDRLYRDSSQFRLLVRFRIIDTIGFDGLFYFEKYG